MRFMMMHKNDPNTEAGHPPPMDIVNKMGEYVGEHAKAGRLLDGAGLGGSKTRTRLTFRGGKCTTQRGGPYAGEHELPAATLLLKVRTREEAIGWAERYGKILGDGEIELGKVNEPWDIGLMPPPENPPLQMLLIDKADRDTEAGGRSPQQKAAISRLKTEMTKAGVLVRSLNLQPSSKGKRLAFTNNDLRVIDGPFVESKELIGGFAVMEMPSMESVIE
ncbi:MAG TPA: YciI family protein, partial [Polyangiaceae bacterium]